MLPEKLNFKKDFYKKILHYKKIVTDEHNYEKKFYIYKKKKNYNIKINCNDWGISSVIIFTVCLMIWLKGYKV